MAQPAGCTVNTHDQDWTLACETHLILQHVTQCISVSHGCPINYNRPFPSSLVPLFQNESKCETFHMKMSSACSFIFMQIKVIFIRMASPLDSLWNRGSRELGLTRDKLVLRRGSTWRLFSRRLTRPFCQYLGHVSSDAKSLRLLHCPLFGSFV